MTDIRSCPRQLPPRVDHVISGQREQLQTIRATLNHFEASRDPLQIAARPVKGRRDERDTPRRSIAATASVAGPTACIQQEEEFSAPASSARRTTDKTSMASAKPQWVYVYVTTSTTVCLSLGCVLWGSSSGPYL